MRPLETEALCVSCSLLREPQPSAWAISACPSAGAALPAAPAAALGPLPEWNLADLYASPDAPEFAADMKRGEALAKSASCGTCHGADLKGLGPVPPLAGRSPSYTVRQLFDMQQGVRKGPWSALMKAAVEKLTIDDMIAIAAYTSSREP